MQYFQTGAPREVLDAQVQRGFAFVEEKCMEELLTSRGKAIPEGDEEDNSWKTELAMACIAAIKPDMIDTEAAACIARGFVEEHPDCYATLEVVEEQLKYVYNAGETQNIAEFVADLARRNRRMTSSLAPVTVDCTSTSRSPPRRSSPPCTSGHLAGCQIMAKPILRR